MTKVKIYSFILLFSLISACGQNYGNKLESNELDIYYTDKNDENLAREIGVFWKKNNLLGTKKQYLQLSRYKNTAQLKIIPVEKFESKYLSFDERLTLKTLQDSLNKYLTNNNLELVIANDQFKTLYNINQ
jgi:hypothetical protein